MPFCGRIRILDGSKEIRVLEPEGKDPAEFSVSNTQFTDEFTKEKNQNELIALMIQDHLLNRMK
jgi:hypothetical protein